MICSDSSCREPTSAIVRLVTSVNRTDFQQLADLRISEAQALLALPAPMPDAAYYIAGYAIECALKACIAKGYSAEAWPEAKFVADCHTHEIFKLVRLAALEAARAADAATNPNLGANWNIVKDWSERSRYERHSLAKAQRLCAAIANAADGVLPWIKNHW
jgi:hypothetical protein